MGRCPEDGATLRGGGSGPVCGTCRGSWTPGPGDAEALRGLRLETRLSASVHGRRLACPDCDAVLAPWRIGQLESWAFACPSCEGIWFPEAARRQAADDRKRRSRAEAWSSFSPEERKEMVESLSEGIDGATYSLSPLHGFLVTLGMPVVVRTQGSRTPWATWSLAVVLIATQLWGIRTMGEPAFLLAWGLHPAAFEWGAALSACFAHFGWLHLISNLMVLFAFGDAVEQRWPRPVVWAAFLLFGAASLSLEAGFGRQVETIAGASGGIAALFGACLVLQPKARVALQAGPKQIRTPITNYGLGWLGWQVAMGLLGLPGIAWYAHAGGFAFGWLAARLLPASKPAA